MTPDIAIDPNAWTTGELINIGLFATLYLSCLAFALWKAVHTDHGSFYWIACAVSIVVGTLTMVFVPLTNPTNGEMPPQAGLGAWVMILGLLGTVAAFVWSAVRRIYSQR